MKLNSSLHVGFALTVSAMLLSVSASPATAQGTGSVTGEVLELTTGGAIDGAQVFVAGTAIGALSNRSGRFLLLNVPAGEVAVRATFIGYGTSELIVTVTAGQTAVVDFQLRTSAIALDEIVVTGAGRATETKRLGNTVATVNVNRLNDAPVQTFSEILQGREPGLQSLPSGGVTGEGTRIRIRGSASMATTNEPIIYVDGIRVDNGGGFGRGTSGLGGGGAPSRLDDIDPESIDRIEILKGSAAATLYGSEASNGVIQIFTKSGSTGAPRWTLSTEFNAITYPTGRIKPNVGYARDAAQATTMSDFFGRTIQPFELVTTNNLTDLFETGTNSATSLSVTGGGSAITYFVNGRFQSEDGPFGGQELCAVGCAADKNRMAQGSATLAITPTQNLRIRLTSLFTDRHQEIINNNNNIFGVSSLAMFGKPEFVSCRVAVASPGVCDGPGNPGGQVAFGTVAEAIQVEYNQDVEHYTGALTVDWAPSNAFTVVGTFGLDFVNQRSFEFKPFGYDVDEFIGDATDGERFVNDRNHRELTLDLKGTWSRDFGSFSSALVLGAQGFISETNESWGQGTIFPGPGLEVVGAAKDLVVGEAFQEIVNGGVFAQEQIGYRDWLYLTVGGRYDKNSAFGAETTGQFYPKASLSFIPSDLDGWDSDGLISSLRLRAAVGRSGLQPGAFDKFTTFQSLSSVDGPGLAPSNLGNQALKPEVSTEYEGGGEVGLFRDRLGIEASYWNRTVKDALVARQFPVTGGFRSTQLDNIGEIKAWGVELGVQAFVYETQDLSIDVFVNAAYLNEKVTDMGGAPPIKASGSYSRIRNYLVEGWAPGSHFGAVLRNVPTGSLPVDTNGDGAPDTEAEVLAYLSTGRALDSTLDPLLELDGDEAAIPAPLNHFLGKPTPDWQGAFGFNVSFLRDFTLGTLFEYQVGNVHVNNLTDAFRKSHPAIGRNTPRAAEVESTIQNPASSPEQRVEALRLWLNELKSLAPHSGLNAIENAKFLRWRELSLTYDIPVQSVARLGMSGLSVTVTGRNIALWTPYSGIDPELNWYGRFADQGTANGVDIRDGNFLTGVEAFGVPIPKRWGIALRATF